MTSARRTFGRVLHAVDDFGQPTETFVSTVIAGHVEFAPVVLCHAHSHREDLPPLDVHVHPKPRSRRTFQWWLAQSQERAGRPSAWRRAIERLLADVSPAVVHAHFGPIGCELVPIVAAAGIPLVTSLYGVDAAVLPHHPRWRAAYTQLFRHGNCFLAEGPAMRTAILAAGAPPDKVRLQPIPIDLTRYRRWAPADPPTIAFVGRLVEKKGAPDALAAFAAAQLRLGGARLVMVGTGPDGDAVRRAAQRLGISSLVDFAGVRSHREVIDLLVSARVLIQPSVIASDGDSEGGAPTILIEAQAVGTPIVATRHADIPHVVPEGPGVHLCAEHDVPALSEGLVRAFANRQPVDAAYVSTHHDVRRTMPRLEQHYRDAIAAHASTTAAVV
jgi:colanic acid/amylovoran biosynthesis glycosyltransferase